MSESSYFWDGIAVGHAILAPYKGATFGQVLLRPYKIEGRLRSYLQELEGFISGNTITVHPGAAFIDNSVYISDADVQHVVVIPPADIYYYTLVLRKIYATQEIRQVMLGPIAYPGTYPTPTINSSMYEAVLGYYQTSTFPVPHVSGSVSMDIIYPTGIGRVPLISRQGGSATDWSSPGITTRVVAALEPTMQAGVAKWTGALASSGNIAITFPQAFDYPPIVLVMVHYGFTVTDRIPVVGVANITAAGATIYWKEFGPYSYTELDIGWIALGPLGATR